MFKKMKQKTMRSVLLLFGSILGGGLFGQNSWSLSQCLTASQQASPLNKQGLINEALYRNSTEQLKTIFFPQLNFNAQATWQSEVTSLPIRLPNIEVPTLSKDQYRATLDINQTIWDGGQTTHQRQALNAQNTADAAKLEADKYGVRDQIVQLYCAVLLVQKQTEALNAARKDVTERQRRAQEQRQNGTGIGAAVQIFAARLLEIDQQEWELKSRKNAAIQAISILTSLKISEIDRFDQPEVAGLEKTVLEDLNRPELKFLDAQSAALVAQSGAVRSKYMPRLNAFSTLGYGRPSLNFLSNEFQPYAIIGVGFRTNISPFFNGTIQREQQQFQIQRDKIGLQRDQFFQASRVRATQQTADIERLENILKTDQSLVSIREKIVQTFAIQLENGIITPSEYLAESTNVTQARINKAVHEIQLIQAYLNLAFINGKL